MCRRIQILTCTAFLIFVLINLAYSSSLTQGLMAWWDFSDGKGSVLTDKSSNGNDGLIRGAKWMDSGTYKSLMFNGIDCYVECGNTPSLNLSGDFTISVLLKCDSVDFSGEPGIAGKLFDSYLLTTYQGAIWAYSGGGINSTSIPIRTNQWVHVVTTYNQKFLKIYENGNLMRTIKVAPRPPSYKADGKFWIGSSNATTNYTQGKYFKGEIAEVRVYNRALDENEVKQIVTFKEMQKPIVSNVVVPFKNKLFLNTRQTAKDFIKGVKITLIDSTNNKKILSKMLLSNEMGVSNSIITDLKLKPGKYQINAIQIRSNDKTFGKESISEIDWYEVPKFPYDYKGNIKLNNVVTQLLTVSKDDTGKSYSFINPKNGWIYITNKGSDVVSLVKPDNTKTDITLFTKYKNSFETMRQLPKGTYEISAKSIDGLIVRSIPEIIYSQYGYNSQLKEFESFSGNFEKKLFKNINTVMAPSNDTDDPFMQKWVDMGGKWMLQCLVPREADGKPIDVKGAFDYIASTAGFTKSYSSGAFADEFGYSEPICTTYAQAIRKLKQYPKFKYKSLYPFASILYTGNEGIDLMKSIIETDSQMGYKMYLSEKKTEADAWNQIYQSLTIPMREFRNKVPGSVEHITIVFGIMDAPNETLDTLSYVNHKTFLDMQFYAMANHPDVKDLGGAMIYLSGYCSDEMLKWCGELLRHYCIEGKSEMLSKEPYYQDYLVNGDFEKNLNGWKIVPVENSSIRNDFLPGFGYLQGRLADASQGDTMIVTKRSAKKPNVFAQTIKNLTPGRIYSLEFFVGDFTNMHTKQKLGFAFDIKNIEIIKEKSFVSVFPSNYSHVLGDYTASNPAYMNYILYVFKAKAPTAKLSVMDWESLSNPGGPIGQELMYNFFQVQPYFMGE